MTDLKLIDELLVVLKDERRMTWAELERSSFTAREAMIRLLIAWNSGEMKTITLSLAKYFREIMPQGVSR